MNPSSHDPQGGSPRPPSTQNKVPSIVRFYPGSTRARLLLPLIGLVITLVVLLQFCVSRDMTRYYHAEAGRDLTVYASMFNATEDIHRRIIQSRFELISKEPRLRSLLQQRDLQGLETFMSDHLTQESDLSAVLRDNTGELLATVVTPGSSLRPEPTSTPPQHSPVDSIPKTGVQTKVLNGSLVDCVSVPIVIDGAPVARLDAVMGRDKHSINEIKQAIQAEIVLLVDGKVANSTIPIDASIAGGLKTLQTRRNSGDTRDHVPLIIGENWICDMFPLGATATDSPTQIALLSSTHDLYEQLAAARWRLWGFAFLTLVAGVPIVLQTVSSATRPITDLRVATHAIARGNLSARVPSGTRGEIGELAKDFNRMTESLAQSIAENEYARQQLEIRIHQRTQSLSLEIAKRQQAEEKLKCHAEGLEHLVEERTQEMRRAYWTLDAMEDGAMVIEPNSLFILFVNQGGAAHLGYRVSEMVSMTLTHVMLDFNPSSFAEFIKPLIEGKHASLNHQGRSRKRDGSILHVETKFQLMKDSVSRPHLIAVVRDVTERIERERIERRTQRLQSIGTLAGGIAHDLNNTLTPILMGIDLVRIEHPELGVDEHFGVVQQSARRAADMAKRLLAFARGADGERTPLDINEQARSIYKVMLSTFDKSIEIQGNFAPNLPNVLADGTQLQQVILNLCVNAQDAMPKGGTLILSTSLHKVDPSVTLNNPDIKPGTYACISVKDSGEGIPGDIIDQIFDPFFTTKGPEKGTGMGLAIVSGIVRAHGGFIRVKSEIGQGSEFKVYLPCSNQSTGKTTSFPDSILRSNGELILIVDDELAIQRALARILHKLGFKIITASNGKEGLEKFQAHQDDVKLVITDLNMPVVDGVSMIKNLRRSSAETPIIYMTGRAEDSKMAELRSLPRMQHLSKPFDFSTLSQAVKSSITLG